MREALSSKTEIALIAANQTQRDLIAKIYSMKKATNPLFRHIIPQFATLETIDECLPLEVAICSAVGQKLDRVRDLAESGQIGHLIQLKTSENGTVRTEEVLSSVNKLLQSK